MAIIGATRTPGRGTAWLQARWAALAAVGGALATRAALMLPTWGWVSGGMLVIASVGLWLLPVGAASGIVALKSLMPRSASAELLMIAFGLVALLRGGWRQVPRAPAIFFGLFLLVALPTVHTTLAPWETIQKFPVPHTDWDPFPISSYEVLAAISLVSIAGLALTVGVAIRTRLQLERFLLALAVGACYPVLTGIKDIATGNLSYHDGSPSVMANFGHPNAFALYLVVLIPILVSFAVSTKNRLITWAVGGLALLASVNFLLTYTRAAWIALVVAVIVAGVLAGKVRYVLGLGAVLLAIGTATGATADVVHRFSDVKFTTSLSDQSSDSWGWRIETWTAMVDANPHPLGLTGFGFGSYSRETVKVFGLHNGRFNVNLQPGWRAGFGAHNDFLNALLENGLLGLIAWAGFVVSLVIVSARLWLRTKEPLALGVFVAAMALFVSSFTANAQSADYTFYMVAGVLTAVSIVTRRERAADEADAALDEHAYA